MIDPDQKRLAEIKERCDAATKGVWESEFKEAQEDLLFPEQGPTYGISDGENWVADVGQKNLDFVLNSRTDVEWLLGERERLEGEIVETQDRALRVLGCEWKTMNDALRDKQNLQSQLEAERERVKDAGIVIEQARRLTRVSIDSVPNHIAYLESALIDYYTKHPAEQGEEQTDGK